MGYLINKKHKKMYIVRLSIKGGYSFKPKSISKNYIKVNDVRVVNPRMIDRILSLKFDKALRRVIKLATVVINDDDASESDTQLVFGEVELVRQILLNRYQKFLNQEKEKLFLQKLRLIENELRIKQMEIKEKSFYLEQIQERNNHRMR